VRYTADSIARGAPLYAEYCAACHGPRGYGDGPAAASLAIRVPNLTQHMFHHRVGDMLWWLQHGIPGTPMPGFAYRLSDDRLWDLLNFLRAQADAERAQEMDSGVGDWRPIPAPDFDFQIGERAQESLRDYRGEAVLLVFRAREARLRALQAAEGELRRAGVRVVALRPGARIAAAYALFGGAGDDVEFLIDRDGTLRARWTPGESPDWRRIPELLAQLDVLRREGPHESAPAEHVH